jgi:hypothetical protein
VDARREILESGRWRRAQRDFEDWLAVQQLYTQQEVAAIRRELKSRVERMSPVELEDFLVEMEDRLDVLHSPAAEDARGWVAQFLATARNAEEQVRAKRPDVMHMTAREIRAQLERFHAERGTRQQANAAFQRARAQQVQSAQATRPPATGSDSRSRAAANAQANVAPADRPNFTPDSAVIDNRSPIYAISPWGTPIRWDPFHSLVQ